MCGKLHASATLPPGEESCFTLNSRLDGLQGQCGHFGEELNHDSSVIQHVGQYTVHSSERFFTN